MAEYKGNLLKGIFTRAIKCLLSDGQTSVEDALNYSTSEHVVGKWIDGKTLYEKTINIGALPNSTTKNVAHGISNLAGVVDISGYIRQSNNFYPLPLGTYNSNNNPQISVNNTNISITTNADWSTGSAYITIRYIKSS